MAFLKRPIADAKNNPSEDAPKQIPAKKILYVEIDDEITSVADKLKHSRVNDVYLVVPRDATMLQSSVNLRILKRHAHDYGKTLKLITNDPKGILLAENAGISVYDKKAPDGNPKLVESISEQKEISVTPRTERAEKNTEMLPTRMAAKKLSLNEFLEIIRQRKFSFVRELIGRYKKKVKREKKETEKRLTLVVPNRTALIALIAVSVLMVLTISYIALPGATVQITPKATAIEQTVNITFAEFEKNKTELDTHPLHTIAMHEVSVLVSRTINIAPTGKIFEGTNAKGLATLINLSPQVWPLVPKTRFQTKDGILFRMYKYVNVPAARGANPGMIDVEIEADPFDAFGAPIGERGNIGPARFFLPGLSAENQKRLYAESSHPMSGGTTAVRKKVTKEDLMSAEELMKETLKKNAETELASEVVKKSGILQERDTLELLKGKLAIHISEPIITMPKDLAEKEVNEFIVTGELTARGFYFNRSDLKEILTTELKLKKSPNKRLMQINEDSVSYRIFDTDDSSKKIKVAATMKGVEEFDISPDRETGERLIEKIKAHITGKDLPAARAYIENLPEVASVKISPWPAWAPTIPAMPDNITVEIVSSE